jgi:hypothetical protein
MIHDLRLIHKCFTEGLWFKDALGNQYFTVYRKSPLYTAVQEALPEAIKLLNAQKDDPSPRTEALRQPTGGTHAAHTLEQSLEELTNRVRSLERVVARVEDRVDCCEQYLGQGDYDSRRDE